ncbi:hypothetical protein [Christiangramia sediminis]|uniref:Lipoprotein n=1 Tax=Christiangramia sediminis TaxID=2881336 RepID=A0A9X1RYW9_9FLAO|nr:hypothetical protein [Christiangramia sediminis]MCB7481715.1 hypothetical protein [Christiangramia sediminis]
MRILIKFFLVSLLFISCQADDNDLSPDEIQQNSEPINTENYEEFIYLKLGTRDIIFGAGTKNQSEKKLGAELVARYSRSGELYHSLSFWGKMEETSSNELQRLGGNIENFNGEGIYKTGKEQKNNCNFFDFGISWYSLYDTGEDGYLEITLWDGENLKGNFDIMVYNANDKSQSKNITGEFKLKVQ